MSPPPAHARIRAFFASAFSWNVGLGMTHLLIPSDRAAPTAALLFLVGFGSGVMTLYVQLLISEVPVQAWAFRGGRPR